MHVLSYVTYKQMEEITDDLFDISDKSDEEDKEMKIESQRTPTAVQSEASYIVFICSRSKFCQKVNELELCNMSDTEPNDSEGYAFSSTDDEEMEQTPHGSEDEYSGEFENDDTIVENEKAKHRLQCKICEKLFTNRSSWYQHKKRHASKD